MKKLALIFSLLASSTIAQPKQECIDIANFTMIIAIARDNDVPVAVVKKDILEKSGKQQEALLPVFIMIDAVYTSSMPAETLGKLAYQSCIEERL